MVRVKNGEITLMKTKTVKDEIDGEENGEDQAK